MVRQHVVAIYDYKDFIFASIRREFEITYLHPALGDTDRYSSARTDYYLYAGFFKNMQVRLLTLMVYAYSIYLCTGILLWTLFLKLP